MNTRFLSFATATLVLIGVASDHVSAQQLKLQVDRQTGAFSLTGADEMAVDFAGYSITSARSTIASGMWNGLRDTEANWDVAGTPSAEFVAELNTDGNPAAGAVVNDTVFFDLGSGVYDPAIALAGLPLGQDVESNDLSLTYYNQITDVTATGAVEFIGEKIYNDIGITVDLADGKAYLENESPNDLTITGYLIESAAGILSSNSGTFTGLGSGFQSPTTFDGENIGEIDSTGTGQLLASSMAADTLGFDLGVVVDSGSLFDAEGALSITFILAGTGETSQGGFVKYINVPTALPGDFNGDLTVNLADYTVWRNNLGAATDDALNGAGDGVPGIDVNDYNLWKTNFGMSAAGSGALVASAAVPEPCSTVLLLTGVATVALVVRRRLGAK